MSSVLYLNGDMRLNIRLTGIIYGITCLSDIGRALMRATRHSSRRNSKGNDEAAAIALVDGVLFNRSNRLVLWLPHSSRSE